MKAIWNDVTLAESDDTVIVEGNHYFPRNCLRMEHFAPSSLRTTCPWKGQAHYYSIRVGQAVNPDAAWYYPDPSPAATQIHDRGAFWKGVEVVDDTRTAG